MQIFSLFSSVFKPLVHMQTAFAGVGLNQFYLDQSSQCSSLVFDGLSIKPSSPPAGLTRLFERLYSFMCSCLNKDILYNDGCMDGECFFLTNSQISVQKNIRRVVDKAWEKVLSSEPVKYRLFDLIWLRQCLFHLWYLHYCSLCSLVS